MIKHVTSAVSRCAHHRLPQCRRCQAYGLIFDIVQIACTTHSRPRYARCASQLAMTHDNLESSQTCASIASTTHVRDLVQTSSSTKKPPQEDDKKKEPLNRKDERTGQARSRSRRSTIMERHMGPKFRAGFVTNRITPAWRELWLRSRPAALTRQDFRVRQADTDRSKGATTVYDSMWNLGFNSLMSGNTGFDLNEWIHTSSSLRSEVYHAICNGFPLTKRQRQMSRIMKSKVWQEIVLQALYHNTPVALDILWKTMAEQKSFYTPSRYIYFDCLEYCTTHLLHGDKVSPSHVNKIFRLLHKIISPSDEDELMTISDVIIERSIMHFSKEQFQVIVEDLCGARINLKLHTLRRLVHGCIDHSLVDLALHIMRILVPSATDDQFKQICSRFLRAKYDVADSYQLKNRIASELLEMGVPPTPLLFSCVIQNAVEAGQHKSALELFGTAKAHGVKPLDGSYSVLLKHALRSGDSETTHALTTEIMDSPDLFSNDIIFFDLLNVIWRTKISYFPMMLELYCKAYSTKPLRDLGLDLTGLTTISAPESDRIPTTPILAAIYIAFIMHNRRFPAIALQLYENFQQMVKAENPVAVPLSWGDHVPNAFIRTLGRNRSTLQQCVRVIKDMTERAESVPDGEDSSREYVPTRPIPPTVRSWALLCRAFLVHRQKQAAQKVIALMREREMPLDQNFWRMLVIGYSKLQDLDGAMDALEQLASAGYSADEKTIDHITKAYDRRVFDPATRGIIWPDESSCSNPNKPELQEFACAEAKPESADNSKSIGRLKQKLEESQLSLERQRLGSPEIDMTPTIPVSDNQMPEPSGVGMTGKRYELGARDFRDKMLHHAASV